RDHAAAVDRRARPLRRPAAVRPARRRSRHDPARRGSDHPRASARLQLLRHAAPEAALGGRRALGMLTQLSIRDFAIVDQLELEFGRGFTALTGETGAGKSILIDALSLALGERAGAELVRAGCERAEVTAEFASERVAPLQSWLREQALEDE